MIFIYRILFFPILIFLLPFYLTRMIKRGGYSQGFGQRFGNYPGLPKKTSKKRVWLQAVSVGEVQAIRPLVDALNERGDVEIILTTTTSTAYGIAQKSYAHKVLFVGYFPLDFWWFSRCAWNRFQPDLAIMMEGELWPEHLTQSKLRDVPVVLINARLSDRSYQRLSRFKFFAKWAYGVFAKIGASNMQDGSRIGRLLEDANQEGTAEELKMKARLVLTGNLKLDVVVNPVLSAEEKMNLMLEMGFVEHDSDLHLGKSKDLPKILLGSSTWAGEEKVIFETLKHALAEGVDCRLLLIPRHAERRDEIIDLLSTQSLPWHMRSNSHQSVYPTFVYLADTTGEMTRLSQIADVAFIGKSLPPNEGGQTPIEAACIGIPMVMGPNMSNFRQVVRSMLDSKIAIQANDEYEVEKQLLLLLKDDSMRKGMSQALKSWHTLNRGATKRTMGLLEPYLK